MTAQHSLFWASTLHSTKGRRCERLRLVTQSTSESAICPCAVEAPGFSRHLRWVSAPGGRVDIFRRAVDYLCSHFKLLLYAFEAMDLPRFVRRVHSRWTLGLLIVTIVINVLERHCRLLSCAPGGAPPTFTGLFRRCRCHPLPSCASWTPRQPWPDLTADPSSTSDRRRRPRGNRAC